MAVVIADNEIPHHVRLVHDFLGGKVDASTFSARVFEVHYGIVEKEKEMEAGWDKPYRQLLREALQRGEISEAEYDKQIEILFGRTPMQNAFLDMWGRLFTACDMFEDDPEVRRSSLDLDENQFRDAVIDSLRQYEQVLASR